MKALLLKRNNIILGFILILSLFLRVYQPLERYNFDHDGDLMTWIVKDIVVDHHPRLIGQLTTAPGIYIGPLFYYLVAPFIVLTQMDPWGAVIPVTLMGILTTLSYYFVFTKLFNRYTGLIGAFLQAVLLPVVFLDRRVVPSTPTNLWVIWYFYTVVNLARGNNKVLPLLGILIGLIWHIHVALLPVLIAIPVAFLVAKKLPVLRQWLMFVAALVITNLPLFVFETRHGFSQTISLFNNFQVNHGGGTGWEKLSLVLTMITNNLLKLFISPWSIPAIHYLVFFLLLAVLSGGLLYKKVFLLKDFLPLLVWILGVIVFYTFSSTAISEYYFFNIEVIILAAVSLVLARAVKCSKTGMYIVLGILTLVLLRNLSFYLQGEIYQKGYITRKAVADFITQDAQIHNWPCVAVSYITTPGENVGFRYFFWLNNLSVNQPKDGGPIYTIVVPEELVSDRVKVKFDHIAVIPPGEKEIPQDVQASCSGPNRNLTDPLFGYTE